MPAQRISPIDAPRAQSGSSHPDSGFTLTELVVAIAIASILAGFTAMLISAPVDAYLSQSQRTMLSDSVETISRSFAEDIRSALPNSVRIRNAGNRAIVEMLLVDTVTFYGAGLGPMAPFSAADRELDFVAGDDRFSAFGRLDPNTSATSYVYPARYLAVHNAGTGNDDAYRLQRVITPTAVTLSVTRDPSLYGTNLEESVTFSPSFHFRNGASPTGRMFLVSGPVTYICNAAAAARTLHRYRNYAITATIPTSESSAQLSAPSVESSVLSTNVAGCTFRCRNGANAAPCTDTLVLDVTVSQPGNSGNEVLRIMKQYPMDNIS